MKPTMKSIAWLVGSTEKYRSPGPIGNLSSSASSWER